MPVKLFKTLFAAHTKHEPGSPATSSGWLASPTDACSPSAGSKDWSNWTTVDVDVPPGPLGIVLDGECETAAVVDDFCELPDGRRGAIELHGGIPVGSVLARVNDVDLLATHKTLREVGDVLRNSAHLKRVLRFKVPPSPSPVDAPTDKQSLLAQVLASSWLAPTLATREADEVTATATVSTVDSSKPSVPDAAVTPAVTVQEPTLAPPPAAVLLSDGRFAAVDVPPGPLGLNLDGDVTTESVVLGFVPLSDGSRGAVELHGGVKPGSVLVEINGESVAKLPLEAARARLGALRDVPRRLVFRLPPTAKQQSMRQLELQRQQQQQHRPMPSKSVRVVEDLAKRRRLELALVLKFDRHTIKRSECWFLLDAHWLACWAAFVAQDGPAPGPIANDALLRPGWRERLSGDLPGDAAAMRDDIVALRDYRGVNPMVWSLLSELHGPGDAPLLARFVVDTAGDVVDSESVAAILREPQPTAVALVQELFSKCRTDVVDN